MAYMYFLFFFSFEGLLKQIQVFFCVFSGCGSGSATEHSVCTFSKDYMFWIEVVLKTKVGLTGFW